MKRFICYGIVGLLLSSSTVVAEDPAIAVDREYAARQRQVEADVMATLSTTRVTVEWEQLTLEEMIADLAEQTKLPLIVRKNALNDQFRTDFVKERYSLTLRNVTAREALDVLLVHKIRRLDWSLSGHQIFITTEEDAYDTDLQTRVYNVTGLVKWERLSNSPAWHHGHALGPHMGFGQVTDEDALPAEDSAIDASAQAPNGSEESQDDDYGHDFSPLINLIETHTAGDSWASMGGDGEISEFVAGKSPLLIVNQTRRGHLEVVNLLDRLRDLAKTSVEDGDVEETP